MQNPKLPEVGKTYFSALDPEMIVFVESVQKIDEDEKHDDPLFMIEGRDPADSIGYEFLNTEWAEHAFILR